MTFHQFTKHTLPNDGNQQGVETGDGAETSALQGVRLERGDGIHTNPEAVAIKAQMDANQNAMTDCLVRLTDTFEYLPKDQQQVVVNGFAPHWTGKGFEVYDYFRQAVAS